ncbi:hypothetical protein PHMEG_00019453 [Phytophthora megakarya]|uniref:Uncharacterized protein n=1 Tax=Phytophthora megakarya TaxID=4795 RepID=A0A225VRW9_9STRA|nr:hypothetical protein PHMEG_00019453 [Phytophthora megakarya]
MSAVTCHFERRGCCHSHLFLSEYKRTNRTKKTKILRCFPHCCPDHLNRSYCGSSLCVRVNLVDLDATQQTESATMATINPSSLLVFAHFEAAHMHSLTLNDRIDYDQVTSAIQTEQTPKGTWIEGSVVQDAISHLHPFDQQHTSLFQINPGARWYYEWESAATKAQRFTKHALRVYVFQRVQLQLCVVGLVSSSEFMVVSYRRAPSEVRAEREVLETLRTVVTTQQEVPADTDEHGSDCVEPVFERKSPVFGVQQATGREDVLWQNRKLWECRHPDIMTSSKQLAVLYHFLRHLSASSYGISLEKLSVIFGDQVAGYHALKNRVWATPTKDTEPSLDPPLSWAFLNPLRQDRVEDNLIDGVENEKVERDSLSQLVKICTSLAGWLVLDSANLEIYRRFLRSYSAVLLDKNRIRAGYVEAVKLVGKLVDRFTGWNEDPSAAASTSLFLLCEEIMTVVFKNDRLKPLRRVLMNVLSSSTMFGMHEFVAQLRLQFLQQQAYSAPNRHGLVWQDGSQASAFDGSWAFNGHQSLLKPIQDSASTDISLGCLLIFMRELTRMTIRPVGGDSLEICSDWNVCTRGSSKMLVMKAIVENGFWRMDDSQDLDFEAAPFSRKVEAVEAWYPAFEIVAVYNSVD